MSAAGYDDPIEPEPMPHPRLVDPSMALKALLAMFSGPVPPDEVSLVGAIGRVSARTLIASGPMPLRPSAGIDGWAVTASDTDGAGPYSPAALRNGAKLLRNGDALPEGADALLPTWAMLSDPMRAATEPVMPGEGVRLPGADVVTGAILCREGETLPATGLPALFLSGVEMVAVRSPRVALVRATDAGAVRPLGAGLDEFFAALLEEAGAVPVAGGTVPAVEIPAALRDAAPVADLVVLLADERTAGAIAEAGRLLLHGLGARPGAATGLGVVADVPVVLVSERWDDAYAAWLILIRPAVHFLSAAVAPERLRARLTRKVVSAVGLLEFALVRWVGPGLAEPLSVGALPPGALAAADAVLVIAASSEGFGAGAEVELDPL